MKSYLECYPCFVRQAIEAAQIATKDKEKHWEILRSTMERCLNFSPENTPVEMGMEIHRIIRRISGNSDPYKAIKDEYNNRALNIETHLKSIIENSADKMIVALKLAAIGNIIDFGPQFKIVNGFMDFINNKMAGEIFTNVSLDEFTIKLNKASTILYIGDNCGEIVFDKIFIEYILREKRVYYGVRGAPVINDLTLSDINNIYFPGNVKILSSCSDAPGTIIDICSDEFKKIFYDVDIVIAKGQGNYESLGSAKRKNMYSLLIVKCPVIARHIDCKVGTLALIHH